MLAVSQNKTFGLYGKKLADARVRAGLTQEQLAAAIQRSVSTIAKAEAKDVASMFLSRRDKLAAALRMSEADFNAEIASPPPSGLANSPALAIPFDVPTFNLKASASRWAQTELAELDDRDPRNHAMIQAGLFRLRIEGDCMAPKWRDGTILEFRIVRLGDEPLIVGRDYVFCRSDGTATFKRLVGVDDDTYTLKAVNQRKYPGTFTLPRQEIGRVAVVLGVFVPAKW